MVRSGAAVPVRSSPRLGLSKGGLALPDSAATYSALKTRSAGTRGRRGAFSDPSSDPGVRRHGLMVDFMTKRVGAQ